MDIAIVTGAETPLGLRIVQSLVRQGCRVHGVGNNFSKVAFADAQFRAHAVDLSDISAVAAVLEGILSEEVRLDLLVHGIDVTPGTPFDKLPPGNLEAILKIGLLGPVMMTRLALPNLLQFRGQLINIITANKNGSPASAANSLIEGGLREMNRALFDQGRDRGLRVTNCVLRQNTELPGAMVSDEVLEQAHIDLEDVARTIEFLIDPKSVNVPEEIVLYPRLSSDAEKAMPEAPLPLDAYSAIVLPPKDYSPPEEPKIPTAEKQQIERTIPYTDEEMEDKIAAAIEDFEAHPERYEHPEPAPQNKGQGGGNSQPDGQGKSQRRRRRRGGRNRNKNRDGQDDQQGAKPNGESKDSASERKDASLQIEAKRDFSPKNEPGKGNDSEVLTKRPKKQSRKPKEAAPDQSELGLNADPKNEGSSEKPVAKKAPKKAARKSAKKAPAKKAAKKAAKRKTAAKNATKTPIEEG